MTPPPGLDVQLKRADMAHCWRVACLRSSFARNSGIANQRRDASSDDVKIDFLGARAELAFARAFEIPHDPSALNHAVGIDGGTDLFIGDTSIDVKATFHATGKLLLKSREAAKADVLVLVTATSDDKVMRVAGWVGRAEFLATCIEEDLGRGKCLTLAQHQLRPISELWRRLRQIELKGAPA